MTREETRATMGSDLGATLEDARWFNERLLSSRTVLLTGGVDFELARPVNQSLLMLAAQSDDPIDLIINSGGGSVSAGFAVYDTIRFVRPRVRCIAAGLAGSIAAVIFCAPTDPDDRISLPNARFLLHQPMTGAFGSASDLEIEAIEVLRIRSRLQVLLSEATGQPLERVERDTSRDFWLSAEEAVEYGLVKRIVQNRDEL